MYQEKGLETTVKQGSIDGSSVKTVAETRDIITISQAVPGFARYAEFELCLAKQTVSKYVDALKWIIRDIGDLPISEIDPTHITLLKQKNYTRGAGEARLLNVVFAFKSFLRYCQDFLGLQVMDIKKIRGPKRTRREVLFLTNEEVQQFVGSIGIEKKSPIKKGESNIKMDALRFRVLVEVLLGTGMRIAEALSLNRDMINFEKGESKIIGKGNKERVVFFTPRALQWIKYYLELRTDKEQPLFITQRLSRLNEPDVSGFFRRYRAKSGINKPITPHILRHTTATNLLFNGCPISHVKEILGHSRLETTCRYYLGIDKSKAKEAHNKFLSF